MLLHLGLPTASEEARSRAIGVLHDLAAEFGAELSFLGENQALCEIAGPLPAAARTRFGDLPYVKSVLHASDAPELHELRGREPSVVRIGGAVFGGGYASLIAGPCAVEAEDLLLRIAGRVHEAGAALLRGGAYKPRTSPHSFQGLGRDGLARLGRVRDAVGIGVVTEVLDPRDVDAVGEVADAFQIGARSMANHTLLREVASHGKPVLLKRGLAATVREFQLAAETLLVAGRPEVVLCERGIRSFAGPTRNILDLGAVAHLKRETHLPILVDPSHASGRSALVPPLARAGIAAGADGVMVEVHPAPEEALSDGSQAISYESLESLSSDLEKLTELDGRRWVRPEPAAAAS